MRPRTTDANGFVRFEAGLARGEGGLSPAMLVADGKGDYAFLSLQGPAFDLTDRGVAGRAVTAGLDAFVYTERGVYRSGETVHVTTLLRDAQGIAVTGVPMTLVVERPDGVEYRRTVVQDQGVGGRSLSFPMISSAPTGTWRVRAYTDPKGPAVGETSFLVEDYVPDRIEFDLALADRQALARTTPAEVTLDGRYPLRRAGLQSRPRRRDEDQAPPTSGRALPATSSASMTTRRGEDASRPARGPSARPTTTARRSSPSRSTSCRARRVRSKREITVRLAEAGGRAVERKLDAAGRAGRDR